MTTPVIDPTVAALIDQIERLTVNVVRLIKQGDDAIEMLWRVADTLPQSCECNYQLEEGRTTGETCLPHQVLEYLGTLPKAGR